MTNCTKECIRLLNNQTEKLESLNEIGIYLAGETDINALKTLKLMILASTTGELVTPLAIDAVKTSPIKIHNTYFQKNESIASNLATNPQYFSLELLEFILKNYQINLNLHPINNGSTMIEYWINSFTRIENELDPFYKRYDMVDKKLNMVEFLLKNNLLNKLQTSTVKKAFTNCLKKKYSYSKKQLLKMQMIIANIEQSHFLKSNLIKLQEENIITTNYSLDEITALLSVQTVPLYQDTTKNVTKELEKYKMSQTQWSYILQKVPRLIKERKISQKS